MIRTPYKTLGALALLALPAACSGGGTVAAAGDASGTENPTAVFTSPGGLLERMPDAPFTEKYRGIRRVELHYDDSNGPVVLEYVEEVGADGRGKFSIHTQQLLGGFPDEELFKALQDVRMGFTYRYRDFQIRDFERCRENYALSVTSTSTVVASIPCVELAVERNDQPHSRYVACVDPVSGIVLRWEERDSVTGQLMGRMEFESFRRGTDVSDMNLQDELFDTESFDLASGHVQVVGFEALQPTYKPSGFRLDSSVKLTDSLGRAWAKLIYGDGVERLVFMHRAQDPFLPPSVVMPAKLGPWTIVTGDVNGYPVIVMGKVSEDDLLLMIQSAL